MVWFVFTTKAIRRFLCGTRQFKGSRRFLPQLLRKNRIYERAFTMDPVVVVVVVVSYQVNVYSLKSNSLKRVLNFPSNGFGFNQEYGVTESWSWNLLYSIVHGNVPWVLASSEPLVLSMDSETVLFWYDLQKNSVKQVEIHGSLCLLECDPVLVGRQYQVPCTSKRGKFQEVKGFLSWWSSRQLKMISP
ncbi:hypothetical protein DVH24_026052 [Malus domestica]|uniref:Uncharacterized protein n=1 Tax=Malus domestica TaxID=3750 RepID=A0A498KHP2_MALDO|nr:hypothetical protein DVH24_026052 [Malus domestica]